MKLQVTSSPHVRDFHRTTDLMIGVILALLAPAVVAVIFFGLPALIVLLCATITALITEIIINIMRGQRLTIGDGSAFITGLLLALTLPPTTPWWMAALGSFFAIAIVKHTFGGIGRNIFNPALAARALLQISFPVAMTTWITPLTAETTATPLGILKNQGMEAVSANYTDLVLGLIPGSLGETSAAVLLIGALYLLIRGIIDWRIPATYIGTVALLTFLFGQDPVFHIFAGGLVLGAFFMATDYTSSPVTPLGRVVFGLGAGLLTVVIRLWGGYPEGVCFSILIMNAFVPLLDRLRLQKAYFR
jgi:electron transport complex protein RnfD